MGKDDYKGKKIEGLTDDSRIKLSPRSSDNAFNIPASDRGDNNRKPYNGVNAYNNIPDENKEVESLAPKSANAYMNFPTGGSFGTGND